MKPIRAEVNQNEAQAQQAEKAMKRQRAADQKMIRTLRQAYMDLRSFTMHLSDENVKLREEARAQTDMLQAAGKRRR